MRIWALSVTIWLICAVSASGQEIERRWPAPAPVILEGFDAGFASQLGVREWQLSGRGQEPGTLWARGALIGGGVGALMGAVAAFVPANILNDGSPTYVSEYTFSWGAIGLLTGAVLGAAIGNEYDRPLEN